MRDRTVLDRHAARHSSANCERASRRYGGMVRQSETRLRRRRVFGTLRALA